MTFSVFRLFAALAGGGICNIAIAWMLHVLQPTAVSVKPLYPVPIVQYSEQQIDSMTVAEVRNALKTVSIARAGRRLHDPHYESGLKQEFGLLLKRAKFFAGQTTRTDSFVCGWPAHGFVTSVVANNRGVLDAEGGIQISFRGASLVLPRTPMWPGFAINTVFYAFVLWLLFAAPFALRRRRRIKRGLCVRCAYPVGTNQRCTSAARR